ncbi:F-box SKIP23-like protein (DUF295) [Rhynchospora pubera]|uniref:F-box SKIP23-like protein (DUF295) n=1 Tax=Rhynchospora pubera TaxID=906938 RepID=A0AAV8GUT4_9POAL|nr:F-box SKIP23-like protein (DUF295) [Rhynchospora pubera]
MCWSELLPELLVAIAEKLTEPGAYLRFRCVCSSWRSATQSLPIPPFPKIPWLILPSDHSSLHHFYSFSEDRLYQLLLPEAPYCDLLLGSSSSSGLLLFARKDFPCQLVHPFTNRRIHHMDYSMFPSILDNVCWDHSSSMVGWRYKPGVIRDGHRLTGRYDFKSMTYCDNFIYALLDKVPEVRVYDSRFEKKLTINPPITLTGDIHTVDLALSPDELFLLVRVDGCDLPYSHIFWLDRHKVVAELSGIRWYHGVVGQVAGEEWKEVSGIRNFAIFVDFMHCFVVEAGCATGLKKNCIYSVLPKPSHHNPTLQNFYIQQFDLDDKSCQILERKLSQYEISASTCTYEPSWFMPNLNSYLGPKRP